MTYDAGDETRPSTTRLLARLMDRAKKRDPDQYLIALLERYRDLHSMANADLLRFLGVVAEPAWVRLGLCGLPRNEAVTFWQDARNIAAFTGADADRLVAVVRDVKTMEAMHDLSSIASGLGREALAAARDTESAGEISIISEAIGAYDALEQLDADREELPLWLDAGTQEAIAAFWRGAGVDEPEPEFLERDALRSLPCAVVCLDHLTLTAVESWLSTRDIPYSFPCASRQVHGCLLAYRGYGLIFVDSADTPEEQRYTVAHELVHFLLDYYEPRLEAVASLGPDILDVLDGRREPTAEEALHALLEGIGLQTYFHLMDRSGADTRGRADGPRRRGMSDVVYAAENLADRVALELLAPGSSVIDRMRELHPPQEREKPDQTVRLMFAILREDYCLPPKPASVYAHALLGALPDSPSHDDWLSDV
jgi:hypothetical protein